MTDPDPKSNTPEQELANLEEKIETILDAVRAAKSGISGEEKLREGELDIIVRDVNELQDIVMKRRDVGH